MYSVKTVGKRTVDGGGGGGGGGSGKRVVFRYP